jgi:hypothetical protein
MQRICSEAHKRKARLLAHSADDVGRCLVRVQAKVAPELRLAAKAQLPLEVEDVFRFRISKIS